MKKTSQQLREDARRIWWAGVQAVQPKQLIPQFVSFENETLRVGEAEFNLNTVERICIVGAGKAGASMTVALEEALGDRFLQEKKVCGWVNVPEDCLQPTKAVHLHAARPAGVNEPTSAGVAGTTEILRLAGSLGQRDLCFCLISGGGSALMPAPIEGLSLDTKSELTREIAARGGSIQQLNAVRRELSNVKGGGLARACRAGRFVTLILSDVLGDDLETIASGPTVERKPTPELALQVLDDLELTDSPVGKVVLPLLQRVQQRRLSTSQISTHITNLLIGNNATAVDAAGIEAEQLGYRHAMISANTPEPAAEEVAQQLMQSARSMRAGGETDCLISGGEPTVRLASKSERGMGGRNQQLALAALTASDDWNGLALLSGGTDGEDGPTDAAGAFVDEQIAYAAHSKGLDAGDYLRRNDAYHFFEQIGGLIKTGPTHTNVCDIRVITVAK